MPQPIRLMCYSFLELETRIQEQLIFNEMLVIDEELCQRVKSEISSCVNKALGLRQSTCAVHLGNGKGFWVEMTFSLTGQKIAKLVDAEKPTKNKRYDFYCNAVETAYETRITPKDSLSEKITNLTRPIMQKEIAKHNKYLLPNRAKHFAIRRLAEHQYLNDGRVLNSEEMILAILDSKDRLTNIEDRLRDIEQSQERGFCHRCR